MKKMTLFICSLLSLCPDWPHQFLTMHTPKNFDQLLFFVIMYQHAKNQFIYSICSFFKHSQFWPSHHQTGYTHFWQCSPPKISNHLLICLKMYQHAKNQLVSSVLFWDTVNFSIQGSDWPHSFLVMPHQKILNQLLIFVNLYQNAKKWGCLIDLLWTNAWFKNLAIWMAESILVFVSGITFFLNRRFVQEHSK